MMAKKGARRTRAGNTELATTPMAGPVPPVTGSDQGLVETTGRYIVVFKSDGPSKPSAVKATLSSVAGIKDVVATSDYEDGAVAVADVANASAVHYEKLGVVVVKDEDSVQALAATASAGDSPILAIEAEFMAYTSQDAGL